jgi:hypothetical protein
LGSGGAALPIALLAAQASGCFIFRNGSCTTPTTYRSDGETDAKDARIIADQARMRTDLRPVRGADQISVNLRLLTVRRTDPI